MVKTSNSKAEGILYLNKVINVNFPFFYRAALERRKSQMIASIEERNGIDRHGSIAGQKSLKSQAIFYVEYNFKRSSLLIWLFI